MALGDHKVEWMAEQLGVSRATIGRWMGDKGAPPRRAYILQWAMLTNVDERWLSTGKARRPGGPGDGLEDECAARDSNPEPSDYEADVIPLNAASRTAA